MRKFLACSVVGLAVFGGVLVACGNGDGGGSQQAFCDELKKDQTAFSDLANQSDVTASQSLSAVEAALGELADKAPSEIKADMTTIANAAKSSVLDDINSAAQGSDFSRLSDLESQFSDQNKGLDQAEANVEKYAKDKCGLDLGGGTASTGSRLSSDRLSDFSDFSDFSDLSDLTSDFSDLNSFSDLSSLTSDFSDLNSLTDLSSLDSVFSSLSSLFSS